MTKFNVGDRVSVYSHAKVDGAVLCGAWGTVKSVLILWGQDLQTLSVEFEDGTASLVFAPQCRRLKPKAPKSGAV